MSMCPVEHVPSAGPLSQGKADLSGTKQNFSEEWKWVGSSLNTVDD